MSKSLMVRAGLLYFELKKVYLLFFATMFIHFVADAQTFNPLNTRTTSTIGSVYFVNDTLGFAINSTDSVLKTIDGGATWTITFTGFTATLSDIAFSSVDTGFVVGNNGEILKSTNGGTTWNQLTTGTTDNFSRIWINGKDIYASDYTSGKVYKSLDTGATWVSYATPVTSGLYGITFVNNTTGYVAGDNGTLLKTIDGGVTWTALTSGTSLQLSSVSFTDANNGIAVGGDPAGGDGIVLKTTDGGATWTQQIFPNNYFGNVSLLSPTVGYISGGDILANTSTILKTCDGGATWFVLPTSSNRLLGTSFPSMNSGYTSGSNGTILRMGTTVNSDNICIGGNTVLTASGADTYTWAPSTGLSATTGASVTATPTVTTIYTVTGISSCTQSQALSQVVVVYLPTVAVNSASICPSTSATLTASGADTYSWLPVTALNSSTGASVIASPTVTTTYTVVGTNRCGNDTKLSTVTILSTPTVTVNSATVCAGVTTTLSAGGANTYTWTPTAGLNVSTGSSVTATTTVTSTYTITGTDMNGCINSTTSTVSITSPAPVNVNSATICAGYSATLTASGANLYSWSPATNLSNTTGATVTASPSITTTYSVIGTTYCPATALATVVVHPLPSAILTTGNKGCQTIDASIKGINGKFPYTFTYQINGETQPPVSSSDSSGVTNLSVSNVSLGSYTYSLIAVEDANNCSSSIVNEVSTVTVYQKPDAVFTINPEKTNLLQSAIIINNLSSAGNGWVWDFGDGSNSSLQNPGGHTYSDTGQYTIRLTVITQYGCEDSTYHKVIITPPFLLYVPNTFTPNGDGINDVFLPKGEGFLEYEMSIYDRWGQLIFRTTDLTIGWDGKVNGGNGTAQMGSYAYAINVKAVTNKHDYTYRGTFTLLR